MVVYSVPAVDKMKISCAIHQVIGAFIEIILSIMFSTLIRYPDFPNGSDRYALVVICHWLKHLIHRAHQEVGVL